VLFRKQSSKTRKVPTTGESKELFLTLSSEARGAIRSKLLEGLAREQVNSVRNKVGDAIAEIARQYLDNGMYIPLKLALAKTNPIGHRGCMDGTSQLLVPGKPVKRWRYAGMCLQNLCYHAWHH
jgi:hypothetical protein